MQAHPAAELFPLLAGAEFDSFKADVEKNGLLEPIWLCEGKILDGRNRYRACVDLGLEPAFRDYQGESPVSFVWSLNVERRHLSKSQHAAIGVEMLPLFQEEAKKRQQVHGNTAPGKSLTRNSEEVSGEAASQAAAIVGVDRSYIYDAKAVKEADPALFEEIKNGTVTVHRAKQRVNGKSSSPSRAERIEKARQLAGDGYRASQIADEIGVSEEVVRRYAREFDIKLPDAAIRSHKIDAYRVVSTTVQSLEGNHIVFDTIRNEEWGITPEDAKVWHASLGKSIKELNWLRNKLGAIADGN